MRHRAIWRLTENDVTATSISCAVAGATIRISPSSIVGVMLRPPPARKRTPIPSASNPSTTDANAPSRRE